MAGSAFVYTLPPPRRPGGGAGAVERAAAGGGGLRCGGEVLVVFTPRLWTPQDPLVLDPRLGSDGRGQPLAPRPHPSSTPGKDVE